ncbi:hypothetical protein HT031_004240 [Scenedesmus sp. PABB004]|nr:hypothetical protein HT031_004240 [Scenedesmus sp. PABB004]
MFALPLPLHPAASKAGSGACEPCRLSGAGGKPQRASGARPAPGARDAGRLRARGAPRRPCRQPRSAVVLASSLSGAGEAGGASRESAEKRRLLVQYVREVQPALMERFVELGPPAVVAAMRSTITNMLGTLPPAFFTVTISTVGDNLSQLMLSVLMTGYLFRNAQYRLDLRGALGGDADGGAGAGGAGAGAPGGGVVAAAAVAAAAAPAAGGAPARGAAAPAAGSVFDDETYAPGVQKSRVQGDVLLWHKENGLETLDAVSYIQLLEGEVARLRQQLDRQPPPALPGARPQPPPPPALPPPGAAALQELAEQRQRAAGGGQLVPTGAHALQPSHGGRGGPGGGLLVLDDPGGNELLDFLRRLDAPGMAELTSSASPEVGAAMDVFVARLMGTGDRDSLARAGSDCTAQELAKLMFWLMVVGYSLRGMEVKLEVERSVSFAAKPGSGLGWGGKDNGAETW